MRLPTWPAGLVAVVAALLVGTGPSLHGQEGFKFKSGVELVNVNVTVTDRSGRFISGLTQEDFVVYDDTHEQEITHFTAERVPVSLGITLDTSGSMAGEKMQSAKEALYVPTSPTEKYQAKAFIDTFVYRAGDVVGAQTEGLLGRLGMGLAALASFAVPLAMAWLVLGAWLGYAQRLRATQHTEGVSA